MTLTEFLLARIAEDEAEANSLPDGREWHRLLLGWEQTEWDQDQILCSDEYLHLTMSKHRLLAECTAKRDAITAAWNDHLSIENEVGTCRDQVQMSRENDNPQVVCALDLIYANHPDYQQEWKP